MTLQELGIISGLIAFFLTWIIVPLVKSNTPAQEQMRSMQLSVDKLAGAVEKLCQEVAENNEELAGNKEQLHTLFVNTGKLERRMDNLETRCINCPVRHNN